MREYHDYDIIIAPVSTESAKKHGISELMAFSHAQLFNLTGCPVTVERCGLSKDGLPMGVQITAKPWHDHIALALGQYLEDIFADENLLICN